MAVAQASGTAECEAAVEMRGLSGIRRISVWLTRPTTDAVWWPTGGV